MYHYGNRFQLKYLVASYLLGKSSNSALFEPPVPSAARTCHAGAPYDLSCHAAGVYAVEVEAYPEIFDVELGAASGGRYRVDEHLWTRDFDQRRVHMSRLRIGAAFAGSRTLVLLK